MSSLPDVTLGGASPKDEGSASQSPGVHVSDDAPTVPVTPVPVTQTSGDRSQGTDPGRGDLVVKGDLPGSDLDGDSVSPAGRALEVARHWVTQAAGGARQVTATPGGVFAAKPPSFAEYRAYVRSRAWVPEGYERGWLIWLPVAYYNTVGNAGVLIGYAVAWLTGRLLHFLIAVAVTAIASALWFIFG